MSRADIIRLVTLAAIWGASFLFMRILSPAIGALLTVELRLLLGGLALVAGLSARGFHFDWRSHWKVYFITGAINSALPFCLYAYAALHMPASYLAILNSSTPLFGAIFAALWLGEALTLQKGVGLVMGSLGVALVAGTGAAGMDSSFVSAACACLGGSACYALAGVYMKKRATGIKPAGMAACSQLAAAAILLPSFLYWPDAAVFTQQVTISIILLSLLCSGVAYLLYFGLIASAGPSKALTVTFLVPGFGMVWGALLLHETITHSMLAGLALIIAGTACVIGLFKRKTPKAA